MRVALMYHGEGPLARPSAEVYTELFDQAALAESLGFEAIWFAEHHFTFHNGHVPSPLLMALATALRLKRIRVGTAVVCLPLHNPLEVAEQAAMVDVISAGRLVLGVGSGSSPAEFASLEIPMESRRPRFREGIDILLRAWTAEPFSHTSDTFQIPQTRVVPKPIQEPRDLLWVAAASEHSASVAGEVGCGLMLPRGRTVDDYHTALNAHRTVLRERGYNPASVPQGIARCVYVGESEAAAKRDTEDAVMSFHKRFVLHGKPPEGPMPSYDEIVKGTHMTIGDAAHVREELVEFGKTTGISHLSIQPTWEYLDPALVNASLRRFGEAVLRALA